MMANTWQGQFPWQNLLTDGYEGTSPVRRFPPNGYGLYDMAGNVWEWTTDCFTPRIRRGRHAVLRAAQPAGAARPRARRRTCRGAHIPRRVIKGGSHLCAPNYCLRYRPAARQARGDRHLDLPHRVSLRRACPRRASRDDRDRPRERRRSRGRSRPRGARTRAEGLRPTAGARDRAWCRPAIWAGLVKAWSLLTPPDPPARSFGPPGEPGPPARLRRGVRSTRSPRRGPFCAAPSGTKRTRLPLSTQSSRSPRGTRGARRAEITPSPAAFDAVHPGARGLDAREPPRRSSRAPTGTMAATGASAAGTGRERRGDRITPLG